MLFLFDEFALDTERRELRGPHGLVALEPQVFDLLAYLIRNRDRVVSKDEILSSIWSGRIVSPSALSTRINAVRHAIGDSGGMQRYIKTLPRKGVRFVGEVREQAKAESYAASLPTVGAEEELYHSALDNRPSIAVLPFSNLSGDPDQDYFADGMVEEIITALSHMRWLSVIARNSSFVYKGKSVDVRQVGRELGARYVLEGSVRKSKDRLRISGQLLDTSTGTHLWADRFDGQMKNVFEFQDQVAESVVGAIAPHLGRAEISRARRKPTESLDAYDYYLRGMANVHRWSRPANDEALRDLSRAIDLDPEFAAAYGLAARCYSQRKSCGWITDRHRETAEAERLALKAAELGADDAVALCMAGIVLAYVVGNVAYGSTLIDRALALNTNLAWAWSFGSWVKIWLGETDEAAERGARAIRLSPNDPEVLFFMQTATAYSHFLAGHYDDAFSWAQAAMRERPGIVITMCAAAASGAFCGHVGEARSIVERLRELQPDMRLRDLEELFPFQRSNDSERWREGMQKAGLPE
jgi:TolB-like protein